MNNRILIVDDDPGMRHLLESHLSSEYAVRKVASGEEALEAAAIWHPDIVFLDIVMSGIDGHEVCRQIKSLPERVPPQVIMVSVSSLADDLRQAFAAGADDYFVKPIRSCELLSRTLLHVRLREALISRCEAPPELNDLSGHGLTPAKEVYATQDIAVFAMTKLAETRDNDTGAHLYRLRDYSTRLAQEMQSLPHYAKVIDDNFMADIYRSSPLHDIGKVGVPDRVLLKPGRLTAHEFDIMKQHTVVGAGILEQSARQGYAGTFLRMAVEIARWHHERWDGSGYPDGLAGVAIPLAARIVAAADVFDALTSERTYKPTWSPRRACEYIVERGGSHFDPDVASCFDRCYAEIEEIYRQYNSLDDEDSGATGLLGMPVSAN